MWPLKPKEYADADFSHKSPIALSSLRGGPGTVRQVHLPRLPGPRHPLPPHLPLLRGQSRPGEGAMNVSE